MKINKKDLSKAIETAILSRNAMNNMLAEANFDFNNRLEFDKDIVLLINIAEEIIKNGNIEIVG